MFKQDVKQLKENFGIQAAEIIATGTGMKKWNSRQLKGCCPVHNEDNPSFSWNKKSNSFKCFSCGATMDIIDYYMQYENMTFIEAIEKIGGTGIKHDIVAKPSKTYSKPVYKTNDTNSRAFGYLKSRGISESVARYCDIQESEGGNVIFQFKDELGELSCAKVRFTQVEKGKPKTMFIGKECRIIPYGMDKIDITKPVLITEGECLSGDTEVLTPNGWVRLDKYKNELVMQVDNSMNGKFVMPNAYIAKEYDGTMLEFSNRNYKFKATPMHNIIYVNNHKVIKRPLIDMPNTISGYIPTAINYDGIGLDLSFNEIALNIAISADGTVDTRKDGRKYIRMAFKKERKISRIVKILDSLGIIYSNNKIKNGYTSICFNAPNSFKGKLFDYSWIYEMSLDQKKFFIEEIVEWDGNRVNNRNQYEYSSKEIHNAEFIQIISHICGYNSTIMKRQNEFGKWYKVSILLGKNSVNWQNSKKYIEEIYDTDKKVYCVNVDTGMILIRYKGKISVIGNCDRLSAIQAGFKNAMSIPNGVNNLNWIEEVYQWLENIEEFIIWMDDDEPGKKCSEQLVNRLGKNKCRIVKGLCNDINDQLLQYGEKSIIESINKAQYRPITGVERMSDIGRDKKIGDVTKTRFNYLDVRLQGIHSGTLSIWTGQNSSGKSTLCNQAVICEALEAKQSVFIFSGELVPEQLRDWIEFPLAGKKNVEMIEINGYKSFVVNSSIGKEIGNWYKDKLFYSTERTVRPNELLERMELLYKRNGVRVFFIDNLMMIRFDAVGNDVYRHQSDFVERLSGFAKEYDCWVHLVAHPRKNDGVSRLTKMDIGGSGDITNLADYVFSVHRIKDKEREDQFDKQGNIIKVGYKCDTLIDVFKNRPKGFQDFEVPLYFDYKSKRFSEVEGAFDWKYSWDNPTWVKEAEENYTEGDIFR